MNARSRWYSFFVVVLVGACTAGEPEPQQSEPQNDPAADRAAIEAMREAERTAAEAGDVEGFLALMAPDIMVMPPNGPAVSGRDAVRAWLEDFMGAYTVSFSSYSTDEVIVEGDLAVERISGEWTMTPTGEGEAMTEGVKGLHVYRRQADGSWLMTHDVWNSDEPPPEM